MTPEKIHLAINHFVFLFPLAALLPLGIGLLTKSRAALFSGVGLALIGSLLTGVAMGSGEEAYKRYEEGPVAPYLDPGAEAALEHHEELAHTWSKLLYGLAAMAVLSLLIGIFRKKWFPGACAILLVYCIMGAITGVIIADSGGEIRRPDFRDTDRNYSENSREDDQ